MSGHCRWVVLLVNVAVVFGTVAGAAEAAPCFDSPEALSAWFTGYYRSPEPQKLVCSLEAAAGFDDTRLRERALSMMRFYAAALESDEKLCEDFLREVSLSSRSQVRVYAALAFFLMNPAVGKQLLERARDGWPDSREGDMAAVLLESSQDVLVPRKIESNEDVMKVADFMDGCWMAFMASGDPSRVYPVVAVAHWVLLEKSLRQVVGKTALWSIASNAREHPRIRLYLAGLLTTEQDPTRAVVSSLLKQLEDGEVSRENEVPLEWKEGSKGLRAALVVTCNPREFFQSWDKSGTKIPTGSCSRTQKGIPTVAAVLVSACMADAKDQCDLVGDFLLLRPDGKDYGVTRDVDIWVDLPAPRKNAVILGIGYMGFLFEPEDAPGSYRVEVTVRDRKSNDQVLLIRSIELAQP